MKKIQLFSVLFLSYVASAQTPAKVIAVADGDTITVLLEDNTQRKIRLAEVDTPEYKQDFGTKAKEFTASQVFGKTVTFIQTNTDYYGRTVAKVYYEDNKYLSKEIIANGWGWWYYKYSADTSLGELQETAKQQKIGLWAGDKAIAPWEFRTLQYKKRKGIL